MNKIFTYFLIGIIPIVSVVHSYGQSSRANELISKAISKAESFSALNEVYPGSESYKTTSTDRAIKTGVLFIKIPTGSGASLDIYDSTVYTNDMNKYSELGDRHFYYSLFYPEQSHFSPFDRTVFAAKSSIDYVSVPGQPYTLYDSISYVYNTNGDLASTYKLIYSSNETQVENYTYNSSNQVTLFQYVLYDATGLVIDSGSHSLRYGPDYVVHEYDNGDMDSAILDVNGRTIEIYSDNISQEFTYDTNGYVSSWKYYNFGMIKTDATFSYEPNYKQYAYEADYYQAGNIYRSEKRVLVGQSGRLDSVYINLYDTSGVYLGPYETTDVTMDSYGNVIAAYIFDSSGVNSVWHRYYYEDVVTGVSDLSSPFTELKIYPNPGIQEDITISTAENFSSVTISSISGQKLMHTTFRPRSEMQLNTNTLSPGNYTITIRSDDGRESTQIFTKM